MDKVVMVSPAIKEIRLKRNVVALYLFFSNSDFYAAIKLSRVHTNRLQTE
jgi:hypothetical protein